MSRNLLLNKNNNNNSNNNNNQISTNPLNISSSIHRSTALRRRWESLRRNHQSAENIPRNNVSNATSRNNEEALTDRNAILNPFDLTIGVNANSDNNLTINNRRHNNLSNNINTSSNIINNNVFDNNNTNNNNSNSNARYNESPNSQFKRLRRLNFIGRQNRHLLLSIYNNNLIQTENNNDVIDSHIINNNHIYHNDSNYDNQQNNNNNNLNNNNINNSNVNNNISTSNRISLIHSRSSINHFSNNNNTINNVINKNPNRIIEEEKKRDETDSEICKEENLGSEIKDTVKCYICFEKITKPKMCPHCHRIACEKCLYNWFINLKKDKCGYCRLKSNFYEMISVPFMDAVVTFVEKFFNKRSKLSETIDKEFLEYCPEHKNEMLYYYCLDCGKPYCKTCFVFFGEEKDKHINHSIIEYEKYKNMSMPLLKKNTDKLESNIQHVEENIKKCIAYKNSYEHERIVGNIFLNNLIDEFNKQIDINISIIDEQIKKLKENIEEYNKYKKEVEYFYGDIKDKKTTSDKSCESLIIKLTKINQQKLFSSKDIEKLLELSKCMCVNTFQSKVGEFNHENMFLGKGLKMGSSPYELVIDNKQRNEVNLSITMPKEKTPVNHNFKAFVFIRQKGGCVQAYDLDEYKEDDYFYYLKKKIPWDYFGQSIFKIKGMLYDFYFE